MANYVWSKVICSKNVLNEYFIDRFPFGKEKALDDPYISFNKLFEIPSLEEYRKKVGVYIYYGFSFSWVERDDGLYEIKFSTRWEYPIQAILRTLELSHEVEWYVVEENHIYVSKFYWSNGVKESITLIEDDAYYKWLQENEEFEESLEDHDDPVWYYLETRERNWKIWESKDNFGRYRNKEAYKVTPVFQ